MSFSPETLYLLYGLAVTVLSCIGLFVVFDLLYRAVRRFVGVRRGRSS